MPQSYEYDESGETWPFFLITVLLIILIPFTLSQVHSIFVNKKEKSKPTRLDILNENYSSDIVKEYRKHSDAKDSKLFNKTTIFIILGWVLVSFLWQYIIKNDSIKDVMGSLFDPYELLNISATSSDKEIKSAYRKLSVKFHPDKLSKDLTPSERNIFEEQFVLITKAYKSLTDDIIKENYLKYGHPDGPQSVSHGIALPSFLVEGIASPLVVLFYFILLAIILPYFVSRWWFNSQLVTKKGIHVQTASYFVDRLFNLKPSQIVTVDLIISWLSHASEFKLQYPKLKPHDFEKLFHDHINRNHINDNMLESTKLFIVGLSPKLLNGLLDIATSFRNTEVALVVLDTGKCIIQALPFTPYSQILQLPNISAEKFLNGNNDNIRTLGKLFTFDDAKIGKILGINDEKDLKETLYVAGNIPHLKVIQAEFKVSGEQEVVPSSIPHIVLKVIVRSPKHKNFFPPMISDMQLLEPSDFDTQCNPFRMVQDQPPIPKIFAPAFPKKKQGLWYAIVVFQKDGKVVQTPLVIDRLSFKNLSNNFDKRIIKDLKAEFKSEDWEIGTIKIPLAQPAPPEKGDYFFRIIIKSMDYFGGDLDFTLSMKVCDPSKFDDPSNDIYEDDQNKENTNSSSYENEEEEEDDDDDDDESDYTDIDTDTEAEAESNCD